MATIANLLVKIGADSTGLVKGLEQSGAKLNNFGRASARVGGIMTKGITLPAIAAGTALVSMTGRIATGADQIDKMSIRTGISRENLQGLRYVTDQVGVSFEALQSSTAIFTNNLRTAQSGTGEAIEGFKALGISIEDNAGNMRPVNDLYMESIRGLANMEDETLRNITASRLFGRQFIELLPLLDAGEEGIEELMKRARDLGLVMSDDGVGALVKYQDSMAEVQMQLGALGREVAIKFAPIMTDTLIPMIQDTVIPMMLDFADRVAKLIEWFGDLDPELQKNYVKWGLIVGAAGPLLSLFGNLIPLLTGAGGLVKLFGGAGLAGSLGLSTAGLMAIVGPIGAAAFAFLGLRDMVNEVIRSYDNLYNRMQIVDPEAAKYFANKAIEDAGRDPGQKSTTNYVTSGTVKKAPVGSANIPMMAAGTNYVPQDMLAFVHKGEEIVPEKYNDRSRNDVTINITMSGSRSDGKNVADEVVRVLRRAGVVNA